MGLFDSLFGSGKTKTKEESKTTQTENSTRVTDLTETATGTERVTGKTTTLDESIQRALGGFITNLIGASDTELSAEETANASLRELGETLVGRAKGSKEELSKFTDNIINEARRSGERQLTRLQTDLAQNAGGTRDNSFVAGATAEGAAALESQLADVASKLAIQIHGIEGADFEQAIAALTQSVGADATQQQSIAQLVNVLRGATITSEQLGQTDQTSKTQGTETLNAVINSLTKGSSTTKDGKGILSRIGDVVSSFSGKGG